VRYLRCLGVLTLCLGATVALPALADLAAGQAAFRSHDYATARQMLSDPSLADSAPALVLLAQMAHKGLGQPVNDREAYADLTLVVMADDPDLSPGAIPERRRVGRSMTPEDIGAAEQQVVRRLTRIRGEDALLRDIDQTLAALAACTSQREDAAERVVHLGPAGVMAIPRLEQLMTLDVMWMPRIRYTFALFSIGTKAVPALCRIVEDQAELQTEGAWNLQQAGEALGGLVPAATAGRACLVHALVGFDTWHPTVQQQFMQDPGQDSGP
jgi:hypothetical protein